MFSKRLACSIVIAAALCSPALSQSSVGSTSGITDHNIQNEMERLTNSLRDRVIYQGTAVERFTLAERMKHYGVPGVAIAVVKDGKFVHAQGFGVLQAGGDETVDANTVFSVGSVSKIVTAAMVMKMSDQGQINLDADIHDYLTSWKLAQTGDKPNDRISLRMILSHTAGFNVHGFGDFNPGKKMPTLLDTLNGKGPASNDAVKLLFKPGTQQKYSGGGYMIAQQLIEDVAGKAFKDAANEQLFNPLGMSRSTFINPLPASHGNIAKAHDRKGKPTALPRGWESMPESAPSGLWTSANDMGKFVSTLINSYRLEGEYISRKAASDMMTKVSPSQHGLGPRLEGSGNGRFFHHAGANNSYKAWVEGHLATGDGLVVLTNGSNGDDLFIEIRNAAADAFGWEINKPVIAPKLTVDPEMLVQFAGRYSPDQEFPVALREQVIGRFFDEDIQISAHAGDLFFARRGSKNKHKLVPLAPNRFLVPVIQLREGIAEMIFHRGSDAHSNSVTLKINDAASHYNVVSAK